MKLIDVRVRLPGVPEPRDVTTLDYVFPADWPRPEGFEDFRARMLAAIGTKWLPVYRMADGEFYFAVGPRGRHWKQRARRLVFEAKRTLRRGRAIRTMWGETYSQVERSAMMQRYRDDLSEIGNTGAIAVHYLARDGFSSSTYAPIISAFLHESGVKPTAQSIVPFHYVLTMLVGVGHEDFFENRHIGIVSQVSPERSTIITASLKKLGVSRVSIVSLDPGSPMLSRSQLSFETNPDLIFVGAGIGATTILQTLRRYSTLTLDVGGFIEALGNPDFRPHSLFRVPDASKVARKGHAT